MRECEHACVCWHACTHVSMWETVYTCVSVGRVSEPVCELGGKDTGPPFEVGKYSVYVINWLDG